MRIVGFCLLIFTLRPLGLPVAGQEESTQLLLQHEKTTGFGPAISVSVSASELPAVSFSVLAAEIWVKTHVLAHYPSTRISTILVGKGVLCSREHDSLWGLILPSVKNLYYSLVRWGLTEEIKVSVALSSDCMKYLSFSFNFSDDAWHNVLKPMLGFLQETSSAVAVDHDLHFPHSLSYSKLALERLGFSEIRIMETNEAKPMSRKLSSMTIPEIPRARHPIPPLSQFAPVPDASFSFAPDVSPTGPLDVTLSPLPPCRAAGPAPSPRAGEGEKWGLWCVAKPTVPNEKLQEAMDYACGEGGANCEEITPSGSCFSPDNLVAHASYAFNSYWQRRSKPVVAAASMGLLCLSILIQAFVNADSCSAKELLLINSCLSSVWISTEMRNEGSSDVSLG